MGKVKNKKLSFFDILNNINAGPKSPDILKGVTADSSESLPDPDSPEKAYNPFMINRGLSQFNDTVLFANEMNMNYHLAPRMQYDFYKNVLRPRKRFSKWFKAIPDSNDVKIIMDHYGYSSEKARDVLDLFSKEELKALHRHHDKGGKA
jgi:hypothetical protein